MDVGSCQDGIHVEMGIRLWERWVDTFLDFWDKRGGKLVSGCPQESCPYLVAKRQG